MIEQIKIWVKNIVLIILFANFIEMLLPNSKFRGYIRVVIGFFVILVMIVPLIELLNFRLDELDLSLIQHQQGQNLEEILTAGNRLRKEEVAQRREGYKKRLKGQLEAVINLNSKLEDPQIEVFLNKNNEVQKIIINTAQGIDPVQVDLKEDKREEELPQQHLKELLVNLYGFDKEQIEVR
ncbi:MAG: stage III sporulation protein AF [Halanaerobacter sp.]